MKPLLIAAVFLAGLTGGASTSTTPEELDRQSHEIGEQRTREVTDAIGQVMSTKDALRGSPALLKRVRGDMLSRFPGLELHSPATVENLIKDLQDYRGQQFGIAADLARQAAEAYAARACEQQKEAEKAAATILAGDLSALEPMEEARLRQWVIQTREKILAQDACAPVAEPSAEEMDMNAVTN